MSINRNQVNDIQRTLSVLMTGEPKIVDGRNWLGHRLYSGAARLDELLLAGATMAEMQAVRGAVDGHLYHLKREHGLETCVHGEKVVFSLKKDVE